MAHTPPPWRIGKSGAVVADHLAADALGGSEANEYYDGYLIAESIAPSNRPLISAAPQMADLLLRAYTHVSHGGPTREEVEAVLKKAGLI